MKLNTLSKIFGTPPHHVRRVQEALGKETITREEFQEYLRTQTITAVRLAGPCLGGQLLQVWHGKIRVTYRISGEQAEELRKKLVEIYRSVGEKS